MRPTASPPWPPGSSAWPTAPPVASAAATVNQIIIEMERAFLFVTGISDGSSLAVMANEDCDVGLVGYEMAVLVDKAGSVLTPELRAELQGALPR